MSIKRCAQSAQKRGVALITALLVLALAAMLAFAFVSQTRISLEAQSNTQRAEQALEYARGLNDFAVIGLLRDADQGTLDSRGESWAQSLPPLPIPNGQLTGYLEDLDGRINVNGFAATEPEIRQSTRALLSNLLTQLNLDLRLAAHIEDAIDQDDQSMGGAEEGQYLAMTPPRRAPNRALRSIEELATVFAMSDASYQALKPHLAALDPKAKLNINTASIPVLRSLNPEISEAIAAKLYQQGTAQHKDVGQWLLDLLAQDNIRIEVGISQLLSVESRYFVIHSVVLLDEVQYPFSALLDRRNYRIVWQRSGSW